MGVLSRFGAGMMGSGAEIPIRKLGGREEPAIWILTISPSKESQPVITDYHA